MSTKNFVPTRKEYWGSFIQEKRILLPLVIGLLIGVICYFRYELEPDRLKMIPVTIILWIVLIFLAIAPLLHHAGDALEKRGISERYERFVKDCEHLLTTETFDELCTAILAIVDNPAYPPEFYEDPSFWKKILSHDLLENLDVGACSRLLRSVKFPELTEIIWTVMIEKLIKKKGIFYFHENAQAWIDLSPLGKSWIGKISSGFGSVARISGNPVGMPELRSSERNLFEFLRHEVVCPAGQCANPGKIFSGGISDIGYFRSGTIRNGFWDIGSEYAKANCEQKRKSLSCHRSTSHH